MSEILVYTLLSTVLLLTGIVAIFLRLSGPATGGWADSSPFWLSALASVALSAWALSGSLKAQGMREASEALAALPVLSASEARQNIEKWREQPVVFRDNATCFAPGQQFLASRVTLSGEEEYEGEESDYVRETSFGTEQAVNKFYLGPEGARVQMEPDGYQVVPAMKAQVTERSTREYSSAVGRFLREREVRAIIPCDATVAVTGILKEEGPFITVTPLSPMLSILTDRPWDEIVVETKKQAGHAVGDALLALMFAGLAVLTSLFMLWRGVRGHKSGDTASA